MPGLRIRQPDAGRTVELTDWLEARTIAEGRKKFSRSLLRRHLREALGSDTEDMDVQVELIMQEMERRRRVAGDVYPFVSSFSGMKVTDSLDCAPYVFLLCLSTSDPLRTEKRYNEVEHLLDRMVMRALVNHFSKGSQAIHFGWPPTGDRPTNFPDAVKWLASQMGLPRGKGRKRMASKDGGVDVVVWRPFRDGRPGYSAVLAQCTVRLDWVGKARDIEIDVWRGWIDFGKDPMTCLAIPFVIPNPFEKWDELRRTVTLVLDRLRLCELLEGVDLNAEVDIASWTHDELNRMAGEANTA